MKPKELTPEAQITIDSYLRSKLKGMFAVLGIVNAVALLGIYTTVSDRVAEHAAKEATENAMKATSAELTALTSSLEDLKEMTTVAFGDTLMDLGNAQERVNAINKETLGLKELKLEHVNEVIDLLNGSQNVISSTIESIRAIKEIERIKEEIRSRNQILESTLSDRVDLLNEFKNQFSALEEEKSFTYHLGSLSITCGTVKFPENSHSSNIKFETPFLNNPIIIATPESDSSLDYGYPIVGDISNSGFRCTLSDKLADNNKVFVKDNGKINYIALGRK